MIIKTNNGKEQVFRLHIYINTICNLNCKYCYMRNGNSWGKTSTYDYIEKLIEKLKTINIKIDIIILGGEPTYYQKLNAFLFDLIKNDNVREIYILSNGTRKSEYYNRLLSMSTKINLYLTYHSTEYDQYKFINNIVGLNIDKTYINILLDDESFDYDHIISELNNYTVYGTYLYDNNNIGKTESSYINFLKQYENKFKKYISIDNKLYNDVDIAVKSLSNLKNFSCYNNNFYCNIHENNLTFYQNCSDKILTIDQINNCEFNISCPLDKCSCQGLLSDYKEKNDINTN